MARKTGRCLNTAANRSGSIGDRGGARHLGHAVAAGHAKDVETVEGGGQRRDIGRAVVVKGQQPAPFDAPLRRQVQHIGGESILAGDVIVMRGEEVARRIGCRLHIGEGEAGEPGRSSQERQHGLARPPRSESGRGRR